jgi:hypothetical protein
MILPFTRFEFLDVFRQYNDEVWPLQLALLALGAVAAALLSVGKPWSARAICAILAFFWAWMGVVYHLLYFAGVNPLAAIFGLAFLAQALAFGLAGWSEHRLRFRVAFDLPSALGGVLVAAGLVVHPLLSLMLGSYPEAPTFGLPCPTTIFTIGMLAFLRPPYPRGLLVIPILWAGFGAVAAVVLGMVQDLALVAAAAVALWLLVRPVRPEAYA